MFWDNAIKSYNDDYFKGNRLTKYYKLLLEKFSTELGTRCVEPCSTKVNGKPHKSLCGCSNVLSVNVNFCRILTLEEKWDVLKNFLREWDVLIVDQKSIINTMYDKFMC